MDISQGGLSIVCAPAGVVRASSIFPILSAILLLLGGVCVASSRFYKTKRHIILGAGILFVVAGMGVWWGRKKHVHRKVHNPG